MTNREIIAAYKILNGMDIETELNTYARWKALGFKVKHGAKSEHKISVWKQVKYMKENDKGVKEECKRLILKDSAFFTRGQVEEM